MSMTKVKRAKRKRERKQRNLKIKYATKVLAAKKREDL